jgi:SpoIID/LytB domain protein
VRARLLVAALTAAMASVVLPAVSPSPAFGYPTANVEIDGHGWGHGRGMGQYGALGYANSGWTWQQIVEHYYSNTHDGVIDDNSAVNVRLTRFDSGGDAILYAPSGATATGVAGSSAAYLVRRVAANTFDIWKSGGCAGPWGNPVAHVTGNVTVTPAAGDAVSPLIQVCDAAGNLSYRGSMIMYDSSGSHVANATRMGWYLRGIAEVPASWPVAAVRAQAVAARSYSASGGLGKLPDTCDSTACQVYGGVKAESTARTQAVLDTAGHVRLMNSTNAIARTEYSSSTGGQTAGGTFPSVVDAGDSVAANPNHNWHVSIPVSTVQSKYPTVGTLQAISVTERTPADGGLRAKTVVVRGSAGQVTVTGDQLRIALGLKSTWFTVVGSASGGVNGYWVLGNDGGVFSFGKTQFYGSTGGQPLNQPVISMTATKSGNGYWLLARDGGLFSYGDAAQHFYQSMGGKRLNAPIVGMARTPSGNGYWMVASDGGIFAFGDAGFYQSMGGKPLNKPIVGMASTSTGKGYWLVASDGGMFAFGDAGFHGSMGGKPLARPVIGMAARTDNAGYWLIASDGGLFAFDAPFFGSLPSRNIAATAVSMQPTFTGQGYEIGTSDGYVHAFGDAPQFGGVKDAIPAWRGAAIGLALHAGV